MSNQFSNERGVDKNVCQKDRTIGKEIFYEKKKINETSADNVVQYWDFAYFLYTLSASIPLKPNWATTTWEMRMKVNVP